MLLVTLGSESIFDRSYQFKELIQTLSEPTPPKPAKENACRSENHLSYFYFCSNYYCQLPYSSDNPLTW